MKFQSHSILPDSLQDYNSLVQPEHPAFLKNRYCPFHPDQFAAATTADLLLLSGSDLTSMHHSVSHTLLSLLDLSELPDNNPDNLMHLSKFHHNFHFFSVHYQNIPTDISLHKPLSETD